MDMFTCDPLALTTSKNGPPLSSSDKDDNVDVQPMEGIVGEKLKRKVKNGYDDEEIEVFETYGCWYKFRLFVRSLWATRQTEDTLENQNLYTKVALRELIIHLIFLAALLTITLGMTSGTNYLFTTTLTGLFLDTPFPNDGPTFRTAGTMIDFWNFIQNTLMDGLYWNTWYNNANLSVDETNFINYESKLLGVPRIRQLRVRPDSCDVSDDFKKQITFCYSMYAPGVEDQSSFGWGNNTAWNYTTANKTKQLSYNGHYGSYSGGGFYTDLKRDKDGTLEIINELFNGLWIDRATRVVFIDFTIYNANINLFCAIKLVMEFPSTGGAIPSWEFRTVKLIRYVNLMDYFVLVCEGVFMIFIFYYIIEEKIEIKKLGISYFKSAWSWLDILLIIVSLICAVFNVYRTIAVGKIIKQLLLQQDSFPNFDFLSYWQVQFNNALGVAGFFGWIKIFKFISFNQTMRRLSSTIGGCVKDMAGFGIMFCIIFLGFAQLGYLMFSSHLKGFSLFQYSVYSLIRIILGDFDFQSFSTANRVLGPIYFMLFVFFVFFVLFNMFIAIIEESYGEVKNNLKNVPNEFDMADYFQELLEKHGLKNGKVVDIQNVVHDFKSYKKVDFEAWRSDLKILGYSDAEIEATFEKYDLDGDNVLNENELKEMLRKFEEDEEKSEKSSINETDANNLDDKRLFVEKREFSIFKTRVDRLETNIDNILGKIDNVITKLDDFEEEKFDCRDEYSNIIPGISSSCEFGTFDLEEEEE